MAFSRLLLMCGSCLVRSRCINSNWLTNWLTLFEHAWLCKA